MARRYGRSARGLRLDGPVPHGHWKSTTFVGALTSRGFLAPYVTDGAMNDVLFKAWVEQMLAPELRISPRTMRTRVNRARSLMELPTTLGLALAGDLEPWRVDAVVARFNQFNYLGALIGSVLTGVVGTSTLRLGYAVPMVLVLGLLPLARHFATAGPTD